MVDQQQKELDLKCYHCGEDCPDDRVHIEDKFFCCQGCKMVFEILDESGMCKYYEIDDNAGISLKGKKQAQYAYLDDPEVVEKMIDFTNGEITKVSFHLPQIHCASCIWLLENLYKLNDGVTHSKVNFLKKEVYITFQNDVSSLRQIVELLDSIAYTPEINLGSLDQKKTKVVDRRFYYKLGVAGFAFGNIMLLSFPEYLGLGESDDQSMQLFFGILNIILSLPLIFYSGVDYLISAWNGLKKSHLNIDVPISLGILSLFGRSVYEILVLNQAGYLDSLAGLIFFLLIGKWFQQNTYYRLSFERDYKSYFPIAATVKRDGKEETITVNKLDAGETVLIRHKELIPADGILKRGNAHIDYSFVTGEADPVQVKTGEKIFAGGRQEGEAIEILITKKVSQSYLTQLWRDPTFEESDAGGTTSKLADMIGKIFTYIILTVAFVTLAFWVGKDIEIAINAFTSVLIIACPCAVALSIPFTFGNAIRVLARHSFYLKNTSVIESLNEATAIVFDKTGTITQRTDNEIIFTGDALSDKEKEWVRSLAHQSSHPLSRQIDAHLDGHLHEVKQFEEISGAGIKGQVSGNQIMISSPAFITADQAQNREAKGDFVKINDTIKGYFNIGNTYREGLEPVISFFSKNYKTYLLSGDNDRELKRLTPLFASGKNLYFNQSPKDKLTFIKKLQQNGENVIMLGDGLNDAGALQQSNTGIVIAENTNNFTPACDAILDARNFNKLPDFINYTSGSIRLVFFAYVLAFIYNIIGLSFAVQGLLSPVIAAILMPASSLTIVLFGVGSSSLLAMAKKIWKDEEVVEVKN